MKVRLLVDFHKLATLTLREYLAVLRLLDGHPFLWVLIDAEWLLLAGEET